MSISVATTVLPRLNANINVIKGKPHRDASPFDGIDFGCILKVWLDEARERGGEAGCYAGQVC